MLFLCTLIFIKLIKSSSKHFPFQNGMNPMGMFEKSQSNYSSIENKPQQNSSIAVVKISSGKSFQTKPFCSAGFDNLKVGGGGTTTMFCLCMLPALTWLSVAEAASEAQRPPPPSLIVNNAIDKSTLRPPNVDKPGKPNSLILISLI